MCMRDPYAASLLAPMAMLMDPLMSLALLHEMRSATMGKKHGLAHLCSVRQTA